MAVACQNCQNQQLSILIFLLLGLLLIVPLVARPIDFPKKSMTHLSSKSTNRTKQTITKMYLHHHPPTNTISDVAAAAAVTTTMTIITRPTHGSISDHQKFKAAAHEVPSGPNPESNK
ncbi:hypothetical protein K2173_019153 [Erythroxylum novogranatense]|uniref:Uncharacterized protein n=1 Tax=Erythroxylum novogranatense TaxID=1862640 RepID=A0AAV8STV7_9ROSI|nr:hypothetical protein K2173_019153 [Erythroxylum novogranatense]